MIGSVRGKLLHRQDNSAIIETTSGTGYRVFVGSQIIPELVLLFTYHHVREDIDELYGFLSFDDLAVFELLLSVSGVGPKLAQTIFSHLGKETVMTGIGGEQPAIFKSVPGVGQKVAEKIVVELKGKAGLFAQDLSGSENNDLFEALTGLGYQQLAIIRVLKELDPSTSTAEKLKLALRLLTK